MTRTVRAFVAAIALVLAPTTAVVLAATAAPAHASTVQDFPDPDDFIDPVTGEFDLEAYLAALNAGQGNEGGEALPRTGSSSTDLVLLATGLLVVGGSVVWGTRRRELAEVR